MNTVDSIRQDLRYGIRQLRMNPWFTLAAVLSLALGIGANTAIFTLFDQIVLRLLPVHNPRELVQLRVEGGRFGSNSGDGLHTFSHPTYLALRERNTVFSGLTGQLVQTASLVGEDRSEMIRVGMVAGNFFNVLGVQPHLGRLLTPDDDKARLGDRKSTRLNSSHGSSSYAVVVLKKKKRAMREEYDTQPKLHRFRCTTSTNTI